MAGTCQVCGKTTTFGHNVSFSKRRTNRRFKANIQRKRLTVGGVELPAALVRGPQGGVGDAGGVQLAGAHRTDATGPCSRPGAGTTSFPGGTGSSSRAGPSTAIVSTAAASGIAITGWRTENIAVL